MRAALAVLLLAGCAMDATIPPEVRTKVVEAPTPVIAPCFTEDERPAFPKPTLTTEAQIAAASPEQLLAAERADTIALEVYSGSVDALFVRCLKKGMT